MDKRTFSQKLLNRYLTGDVTPEEKNIVEGWYNQELSRNEYKMDASQLQHTEDEIWQVIQEGQNRSRLVVKQRKLWQVISVAAASVALIVLFGTLFYHPHHEQPVQVSQTVVSPAKVNNLIQLPDGSMVILDKGSKLVFAKSFEGKKLREVYLTGKAFFDVKHNTGQPFIVHSGKIKTTVLGTAFDISAQEGATDITVRVIRGKVNVATDKGTIGDLLPNRKVTYHTSTDQSSFAIVNAKEEMRWTSQDMLLNDITFEAICKQLEQRYNVKVVIRDENLKAKRFTISLTANEDLDNFLQTVCDFNGATFTYNKPENTFIITAVN